MIAKLFITTWFLIAVFYSQKQTIPVIIKKTVILILTFKTSLCVKDKIDQVGEMLEEINMSVTYHIWNPRQKEQQDIEKEIMQFLF